jgi:hypothetical protein
LIGRDGNAAAQRGNAGDDGDRFVHGHEIVVLRASTHADSITDAAALANRLIDFQLPKFNFLQCACCAVFRSTERETI